MSTLIEIFKETFSYLLAGVFTLVGFFYKPEDSTKGDKNPVILISGILGTALIWNKLRRRLIKEGYPVYIPWLSYQTAPFEINAKKLEQFILEKNLRDVYIVGHSAGGIIVTQMGYKGRDRIKKLFAVSTPFHGTLLALFIFFIPSARQLIYRSSFLKNNEINFMTFPNLQCLYSRFDLLIVPGFQGKLGRNDDIEYPGLGHINIIMSSDGVNFILSKLEIEESKEEKKPSAKIPVKSKAVVKKPARVKPVLQKVESKKTTSAQKRLNAKPKKKKV